MEVPSHRWHTECTFSTTVASIKDKSSLWQGLFMGRICTKCKDEIPDSEQLDMVAEKYPVCNKCWAEWKEYRVMVMNEMRLDMSMPDHRKLLKKHEKKIGRASCRERV